MSRRPRGLTTDEMALWGEITRLVRPMRGHRLPPSHNPPDLIAPRTQSTPAADLRPASPAIILERPAARINEPRITVTPAPRPSPADRGNERKVRRGQVDIGARLDLHGYTQDQAVTALARFLMTAHAQGCTAVLVVTGKGGQRGRDEAAPGVLKRRVPEWLASPEFQGLVSGLAPAHRRHGGGGALYVFLRRAKA